MSISRVEQYWLDLLDTQDNRVETLTRSTQGSLVWDISQPIQRSGKVNVIHDGTINWLAHRIQVWFQVNNEEPWSMGIYVPTAPRFENRVGIYEFPLEIQDKTVLLLDDQVEDIFQVSPYDGTPITQVVKDLILSTGETRINATDNPAQVRDGYTWEAGTPKLTIVNDLLKYINYKPLWVDDYGAFQVGPYSLPQNQPLVRSMIKGQADAIHDSRWSLSRDLPKIPNKVILKTGGSGNTPGFSEVVLNMDPNSPFSIPSMGRVISHTEQVEAETPQVLRQLAERRMQELSSPYGIIDIDHLVIPAHLGDKMRLVSGRVDFTGVVERMDYKLTPGSRCSATWKQVIQV